MDNLISPLIKAQHTVVEEKSLMDDPYAYVTQLDKLTRHEFGYIAQKIEHGWITQRDIEIVKFVFVHRWMTLSQIEKLFFQDSNRKETTRKRVQRLLKYGLLRKIQWSSYSRPEQNKPSFYELGASGADILKYQFGMQLGHRDPRNPKPASMLYRMKYIATNELYCQLKSNFDMVHFEFHPTLTSKDKQEQQVPMAKYSLKTPNGRNQLFYLICHREDEKWIKTIRYQASFFKSLITTQETGAVLVCLVSSDEKALLASKIMEQEGASQFTWYVMDTDLYNDSKPLRQSFFTYKNGKKLYYDLQ
ncbi:replication-relaxation family protein [Paenibacillus sp. MMO-58]|uniref:replication-relaxation family protein n=1 Tax=Paenibacillus sp. MMO-58 TaxID=3081290 RepID=UPI00301909CA